MYEDTESKGNSLQTQQEEEEDLALTLEVT